MTTARKDFMQADKQGVFHIHSRCARRCFLFGFDEETGKDYSERKEWIPKRLSKLQKIFLIDIYAYAAMSNHYHIILHNRPDLAKDLTVNQIAERWLTIHPSPSMKNEKRNSPKEEDISELFTKYTVEELRLRLSDISWFMRELNQYIAVKANRSEQKKGVFFDGRFKSQYLADKNALLACMIYIDLNPIRAKTATTIEDSYFTSGHERMRAQLAYQNLEAIASAYPDEKTLSDQQKKAIEIEKNTAQRAAWLAPLAPKVDNIKMNTSLDTQSLLKPFLTISTEKYLQLLDLTGREYHKNKPGRIEDKFAPILEIMGFEHKNWLLKIKHYGAWYYRAVGPIANLAEKLKSTQQQWFKGVKLWLNPKLKSKPESIST